MMVEGLESCEFCLDMKRWDTDALFAATYAVAQKSTAIRTYFFVILLSSCKFWDAKSCITTKVMTNLYCDEFFVFNKSRIYIVFFTNN